ncbi:MAG: deoxyribose-phosphate aldolase [Terracidiphilus sp.]
MNITAEEVNGTADVALPAPTTLLTEALNITAEEIKEMLDVAFLAPTTTPTEVEAMALVVRNEGYGQMCVNTAHIQRAAAALKGSRVKLVAPVGFPLGAVRTEIKVFEAEHALADGAAEIDMVLNIGALIDGDFKSAENDVRAVVKAADGAIVKVIIETPFLTDRQKADAAHLVQAAGASFVKTCTGFSPDPSALYEDIRLIRQTVGPNMGVKASGRIGNYFRYAAMLEAGANRIGLNLQQSREILRGWSAEHPRS